MATTFTGSVRETLKWDYANVLDVGNAHDIQSPTVSTTYTDGESANQAEGAWRKTYAPAASATTSIDFAGTAIQDAFGNNITAKVIKFLRVRNTGTVALTVGGNANAVPFFGAVGDFLNLPAGARFTFDSPTTGIAVTAGTGDILDVVNTSGSTAGAFTIEVIYTK
jgi:hypothetical protein